MTTSRWIQVIALLVAIDSAIVLLAEKPWPLVSWLVTLVVIGVISVRVLTRRARSR